MKQVLIVFGMLFCLISCEIQYDGETKIVVTGKLIDENENSLSEKDIEVIIEGGGLISPNYDLISYGKSDQNGNFTLVFPAPKEDNPISISINNPINQTNEFQGKEFLAQKNNFENYKLNLNKITLYKAQSITNLRLILNNTTKSKRLENILIEGKMPNSWINLNPLPNNTGYLETYYNVIKNQNIVLKYTVVDYSNSTIVSKEQTVSIPVNDGPVIYTITY